MSSCGGQIAIMCIYDFSMKLVLYEYCAFEACIFFFCYQKLTNSNIRKPGRYYKPIEMQGDIRTKWP